MQTYYKYLSQPWDIFENGYIRATQLSAINDPFESAFCKESLEDLASYFDYPYTFDPETHEKVSFTNYIQKYKNRIGIISLSETNDNLLMWSHYANEHKGLMIGLRYSPPISTIFSPKILINEIPTDSWSDWRPDYGIPQRVRYSKRLKYRNDKFDGDYSNIAAEGAEKLLVETFLQKSDEWQYEKEHRILFRLEQADKVIIRQEDINNIESKRVKEMIFDCFSPNLVKENRYYKINLNNTGNSDERIIVANTIAKFSSEPSNLYLFKLDRGAIKSCTIGANRQLDLEKITSNNLFRKSPFSIQKAVINHRDYYLDFKEL